MMNLLETMSRPFVNDRKAERRRVKIAMEQSAAEWKKINAMDLAIKSTESEIDEATSQHGRSCEPIQRELAEIQAKQVEELVDKAEPSMELESRRLQLVASIDANNESLAEVARRGNDRIARLQAEYIKLLNKTGHTSPQTLQGELLRLGNDELLADLRFEQATAESLTSRVAMSEALLRQAQSELAKLRAIRKPDAEDAHRTKTQEAREKRHALDLKRLGAALGHANERTRQLTEQIIDE
jgi:hypothetical protein